MRKYISVETIATEAQLGYTTPDELDIHSSMVQLGGDMEESVPAELVGELCNFLDGGEDAFLKLPKDHPDYQFQKNFRNMVTQIDYGNIKGSPLQKATQVIYVLEHKRKQEEKAIKKALKSCCDYQYGGNMEAMRKAYERSDGIESEIDKLERRSEMNLKELIEEGVDVNDLGQDSEECEGGGRECGNADGNMRDIANQINMAAQETQRLQEVHGGTVSEFSSFMKFKAGGFNMVSASKMTAQDVKILENLKELKLNFGGTIGGKSRIKRQRKKMTKHSGFMKMRKHSELKNIKLSKQMSISFEDKYDKKKVMVRKRYESNVFREDKVVIVDDSGSMDQKEKIAWVFALVAFMLEEVRQEKSHLYICTFEGGLHGNWKKISTKEEADEFWETRKQFFGFNGWWTDVENCIRTVEAQMSDGKLIHDIKGSTPHTIELEGENPHIIVINDGEDTVNYLFQPENPINAFILGTDNEGLESICNNSRGVYHRFL